MVFAARAIRSVGMALVLPSAIPSRMRAVLELVHREPPPVRLIFRSGGITIPHADMTLQDPASRQLAAVMRSHDVGIIQINLPVGRKRTERIMDFIDDTLRLGQSSPRFPDFVRPLPVQIEEDLARVYLMDSHVSHQQLRGDNPLEVALREPHTLGQFFHYVPDQASMLQILAEERIRRSEPPAPRRRDWRSLPPKGAYFTGQALTPDEVMGAFFLGSTPPQHRKKGDFLVGFDVVGSLRVRRDPEARAGLYVDKDLWFGRDIRPRYAGPNPFRYQSA